MTRTSVELNSLIETKQVLFFLFVLYNLFSGVKLSIKTCKRSVLFLSCATAIDNVRQESSHALLVLRAPFRTLLTQKDVYHKSMESLRSEKAL